MKFIKNIGISILYISTSFLILTLLITVLSYFNIVGDKLINTFKILIPITSLFIGGLYLGKKSIKKGWLEGLKLSIIIIILLLIINSFIGNKFEIKNLIFYTILTISSIFGCMIGINIKKTE